MFSLNLSGVGTFTVKRGDGTIETFKDGNMLLEGFYNTLLSNTQESFNINPVCKVGTGKAPTIVTMTKLDKICNLVSGVWPSGMLTEHPLGTILEDGATIYAYHKYNFTFEVGQIVGEISEYGINISAEQNDTVHTRVVLKDSEGNVISIKLEEGDQLIVDYVFSLTLPVADSVKTVTAQMGNTTMDFEVTFRHGVMSYFANYLSIVHLPQGGDISMMLSDKDLGPAGVGILPGTLPEQEQSTPIAPHVETGQRSLRVEVLRIQGNFPEGIKSMAPYQYNTWYKIGFNPPIPKSTQLGLTFNLNLVYHR